ncbi:MAG: hypothetical protein V3R29_00735 [Candidatus Acidoferrales bacterium]
MLEVTVRHAPVNTYRVGVEANQAGKYEARIQARYTQNGWTLRVYFLAASPERLIVRLQSVLRYLQRQEEELWMWGSSPSDRGLLFQELLEAAGLELDRRKEFPRAAVVVAAAPGESLRPLQLAELKRKLTQRLSPEPRVKARSATALRSA